jgi:EAL domain-containing protein (putative c-di-GMP-specific phosphodiesterase class I)
MSGSFDIANLRVMVVDDDPMMTALIDLLLRSLDIAQIETLNEGAAALGRLTMQTADLLICDLNMPDMDGVQLMNRVASLEQRPAIILLSGEDPRILDSSRQFAEAKRLSVLGVLRKPLARESLMELLRRYRPDPDHHAHERQRTNLSAVDLTVGLGNGALHLVYQPKVDLRSGALVGVESLLRWSDPRCGSVNPADVVASAERHELIDELTLAVLAHAARDRHLAASQGLAINFAVNLSLRNLKQASIVGRMHEIVTKARNESSDFTLEVTETHLVDDVAGVLEALIRLRLLGFKIALDDYGTGASTMQMLSRLPSTELKIDRSFVAAAPNSRQGRAFLKSAIELGLQMGQSVVAEGIETESERALALELGCQFGQGFLFARPLAFDALLAWDRERPRIQNGNGA